MKPLLSLPPLLVPAALKIQEKGDTIWELDSVYLDISDRLLCMHLARSLKFLRGLKSKFAHTLTPPVSHPVIYPSLFTLHSKSNANQPRPTPCYCQETNSNSASLSEIKGCMLHADVRLCLASSWHKIKKMLHREQKLTWRAQTVPRPGPRSTLAYSRFSLNMF